MIEREPDWHIRDVMQLTFRLPPEPEPKKVLAPEPEPKKERAVKPAAAEKAVKG